MYVKVKREGWIGAAIGSIPETAFGVLDSQNNRGFLARCEIPFRVRRSSPGVEGGAGDPFTSVYFFFLFFVVAADAGGGFGV